MAVIGYLEEVVPAEAEQVADGDGDGSDSGDGGNGGDVGNSCDGC